MCLGECFVLIEAGADGFPHRGQMSVDEEQSAGHGQHAADIGLRALTGEQPARHAKLFRMLAHQLDRIEWEFSHTHHPQ